MQICLLCFACFSKGHTPPVLEGVTLAGTRVNQLGLESKPEPPAFKRAHPIVAFPLLLRRLEGDLGLSGPRVQCQEHQM